MINFGLLMMLVLFLSFIALSSKVKKIRFLSGSCIFAYAVFAVMIIVGGIF